MFEIENNKLEVRNSEIVIVDDKDSISGVEHGAISTPVEPVLRKVRIDKLEEMELYGEALRFLYQHTVEDKRGKDWSILEYIHEQGGSALTADIIGKLEAQGGMRASLDVALGKLEQAGVLRVGDTPLENGNIGRLDSMVPKYQNLMNLIIKEDK